MYGLNITNEFNEGTVFIRIVDFFMIRMLERYTQSYRPD